MGLPRTEKLLRDAYARGADKGLLLTDKKLGGADTCATAYTLAAAEKKNETSCLISVTKNINFPVLPTVKRKLESLKVEIDKCSLVDLKPWINEEEAGFKGSPTKVVKIEVPKEAIRENVIYRNNLDNYMREIINAIKSKNII